MNEPLVSVQMVTYNHARFVREAVEGVLRQKTEFSFELVIGEDCSTDGTREIVLEYERAYPDLVRVVTSETNVGAKKNSYRTMKACRGKYVALCEGDDYWHSPLKLQKQANYLESHAECAMVHSSYDVYHERMKRLIRDYIAYRQFEVPSNPDISEVLSECRGSFRIQTCTVMIQRAIYEQTVESDPYLHQSGPFLMGDVQLWAEVSLAGRVGFLPDSLATYRLLDESGSRSLDRFKQFRFDQSHCEMWFYLCDKHKLPPNVRRTGELGWCETALRQAFHEQNAELAREVRKKKGAFTLKEWLLFLGATSKVAHPVLRVAALCRDRFTKEPIHC